MDYKNMGKRYKEDLYNKNGRPRYFTKENATKILGSFQERKINTWEKLVSTYSKEQVRKDFYQNIPKYTSLEIFDVYAIVFFTRR